MFTLTGTLEDHGGKPLAHTTVIITPTPSVTVDTAGKVLHLGGTEATTDADGKMSVQLESAAVIYTVRSTAGGRLRPQRFNAPEDGATVDLADVVDVEPAPILPPTYQAPTSDRGVITIQTGA